DVRDPGLRRSCDSFERADLVADRCDLRGARFALRDFFYGLSNHRRAKPPQFRGQDHYRYRNRERDRRRDLSRGQKRPQRLAAVVRDPTQVFGQAARNRDEDNLRNFVWMKRTKFFLKRRLSIFADLKENQCLVASFDFALPAINRFNRWQNVPAG